MTQVAFKLDRRALTEALYSINPGAGRDVSNDIAHHLLHALEDIARQQPFGTSFRQGHEVDDNGHDNYELDCTIKGGGNQYTVRYDDGTQETFHRDVSELVRKDEHKEALRQAAVDRDRVADGREPLYREEKHLCGSSQAQIDVAPYTHKVGDVTKLSAIVEHTTAGPNPGIAVPKGKDWTDPHTHLRDILGSEIQAIADVLKANRVAEALLGTTDITLRREVIARARGIVLAIDALPQIVWPQNARVLGPAIDAYEANLNANS